jgi:hypothetical protein
MTRSDWHILTLLVLALPLLVTGSGLAISRGHGAAAAVAVVPVGALVTYLARHRIRGFIRAAGTPHLPGQSAEPDEGGRQWTRR